MTQPFQLVQLSDPHIGAAWEQAGSDPAVALAAAVEAAQRLGRAPDALLVSGDLTDNAADSEYELVRELLASIEAPVYVLPGNHDDRDALRRHFGVPGAGGEPVQYAVDLGQLRLVMLDTTVPGQDGGALDPERLAWLDSELAAAPDMPTLLAMHHPPLFTGMPAWDAIGLPVADRRALEQVVARHRQVRRLVGGHFHRTITADLGGRAVLAVPSTYVQARLDFGGEELVLAAEPAAFAVHALVDGDVVSHVQPVA